MDWEWELCGFSNPGDRFQEARSRGRSTALGDEDIARFISDSEVAKRKAGEPLKPRVAQKLADEGLFGDRAYQSDLGDLVKP